MPELNKRHGYPHLNYPSTHYLVTPFDGVYNIGDNNGVDLNNNPFPDNQMHVEAPQQFIGDYLARTEVAPEDLYLGNRTIGGSLAPNYIAEFEARNNIIAGKNDAGNPTKSIYSINNYNEFLTPDGDFEVNNGSKAIFHCGSQIQLHPGFSVKQGSQFRAYILPYTWSNSMYRTVPYSNDNQNNGWGNEISGVNLTPSKANDSELTSAVRIYPNPSEGLVNVEASGEPDQIKAFDLSGKLVYEQKLNADGKQQIDLRHLPNGVYLIEIDYFSIANKNYFKCVISK